jgi:glycosyltransferase involved in cell wall biosynthesis
VLVITTPGEGVLEAIQSGVNGVVCELDDPAAWERALARIAGDDGFADRLRRNARAWVEENFDAVRNARLLLARYRDSMEVGARANRAGEGSGVDDDDLL